MMTERRKSSSSEREVEMEGLDGDCESEMSSSSTSGKVYVIEKKRYCMRARRRWARASRCAKLAAIIAVVLSCLFFAAVLAVGASSSVIAESLFLELANSNQPRILEVELLPTSTMVPTTNPVFRVRVRSEVENPSQFGGVVSVQQTSVRQSISSPIFLDGSIESSTVVKGSNVNTKLSERRDGGDGKSSSSRVKSENEGVSRREESANSLLFPPHSNTTFDMVVSFAVLDQGEAARVGQGCIVHNQCEVDVTSIVKGRMAEMEVAMFTTSLSFTVSLPGVYFGELEVDGIVANEVETVGSDPAQTAFFFSASARMKWRVNLATGMMPSLPFSIAVVKEGEVKSNMEVAYGWNKVMPFPASTSLSDNSVASTHLEGVFKMDGVDDISSVVVRYFEGGRVNVEAALLQAGHDSCPFSICPPAPAFASILSSVRLRSSLISNGKVTARLRSFDVKEGGNGSLNVMASIVLSNPSIVNGTIKHAQFSLFPSLSSSSARSSVVLPSSSPSSSSSSSSSSMSAFGVSDLHDIKVERGEGVYDISARIVDTTSDAFSNLISSYLNMQNASFTAVVNKPSVVKGYTFTMSIPPLASSLLSRLMLVFNAQSFLALMRGEGVISACMHNPLSVDITVKAMQFDVYTHEEKEVKRKQVGSIKLASTDKNGGSGGGGGGGQSSLPLLLPGKTTTASTITFQLSMLSNLATVIPPFLSVSTTLPSCGSMCLSVDLEGGKLVLQPGTTQKEIVVDFGCASSSSFCSLPIRSSLQSLTC